MYVVKLPYARTWFHGHRFTSICSCRCSKYSSGSRRITKVEQVFFHLLFHSFFTLDLPGWCVYRVFGVNGVCIVCIGRIVCIVCV